MHISNNLLGACAVLLIILSMIGSLFVYQKADEIESRMAESITGQATGTVRLSIMRSLSEMDFHAVLADDNESVMLVWNDLGFENVSIFITDDLVAGFDLANPNVTGITAENWTDTNASQVQQRYYRIGVWRMGYLNVSLNIVGKFDISLTQANGRWNYISLPTVPYNMSRDEVLRSIKGRYDWIYEYVPLTGTYNYWFDPFSVGNIDELHPNKCYIIQATEDYTLTVVGDDNSAIQENMVIDHGRWNYLGWINEVTNRSVATASVSGDFDWIYEYVSAHGNYSYWFDPFAMGNIHLFNPGSCYIFQATVNNTVLNHTK